MFSLSPTALNEFRDCPLCFWLHRRKGIASPGGPLPTITNGLDRVIKEYMNRYRPRGSIPPFLEGKVPGRLIEFLPATLACSIGGNTLSGRLDECLVMDSGNHAPLDHKTRGFALKDGHEVHPSYQLQMDCYALLLQRRGHAIGDEAFIVYYYPDFGELHQGIPFRVSVHRLRTNPRRAEQVFADAVACLQGEKPEPGAGCGLCAYVGERLQPS
ncbi:MAG: hypothetical protein HYY37_02905 [Candidatus Aenigmarchaeota archaeon]|nr:hypothetical protein [Candidatus Aenigmarchaeota archaeon]